MNKNVLAEACLVLTLIGAAMASLPFLLLGIVGIAVTLSKAVIFSLLVSLILWLYWDSKGRQLVIGFALAVVLTVTAFLPQWASLAARVEIWEAAWANSTLWGNGLGSFMRDFSDVGFVHWEALHLVYELGVLALIPLGGLAFLLKDYDGSLEYAIMAALVAVSFFSFPVQMPLTGFVLALALGRIIHLRGAIRLGFNDGRVRFGRGPVSPQPERLSAGLRLRSRTRTKPLLSLAEPGSS